MAGFALKTKDFEGPIDLLLRLVEERKLAINLVSLAEVTDKFIEYLEALGRHKSKDEMANFLLVAATLMLIKSVALLPDLQVSQEEAGDMADLERRLAWLQQIRAAEPLIQERFGRHIIFARQGESKIERVFSPGHKLGLETLRRAVQAVITAFPQSEVLPPVMVQKVLSLEEIINQLKRRVEATLRFSFHDFVKDKTERVNVIVSFLGLLELTKRGLVAVEQRGHFADIDIETTNPGVPKY